MSAVRARGTAIVAIAMLMMIMIVSVGGLGTGCGGPDQLPCEEEPTEGTEELERIPLMVRNTEVSAEVALGEEARRSAWAGRRCDLEALLWVPDAVGPAAVELCEVQVTVDLAFVREGEVVFVDPGRPPCEAPCEACPRYGADGLAVDAVLWFPAGEVDVAVGDSVSGLDAVALPTG